MTPLNIHDLTLLQILLSKSIFKKALRVTSQGVELFPIQQVPHLTCAWNTYLSLSVKAKKEHKEIDIDELIASIIGNMPKYNLLAENKSKLKTILERLKSGEEVNLTLAEANLKSLVKEAVQRQVSKAVVTSAAYESIKEIVEKGSAITADIESSDSANPLYINPLMSASKFLKRVPKRPTGVVHFDTVTHGGMAPGEVCLIAGLTGGGKSMTTNQIVGTQLLLNKNVGWFTYEQPFDQDLMQRLVAFVTGYSLDKIRVSELEELPEEIQDKYKQLMETMKDKLIATDFSNTDMLDKEDDLDDGSVYSLRKRLDLARDHGINLDYMVVDWLGAAVKKIATVRNIDIGKVTNYIAIANEYLTDLVQLAKDFKVPIIIFHQLKPDIKNSPPSRKPASTELQMIASAGNWVQYAITIGKLDENHRCWFICDKNRTGFTAECVIELDGEHARFKMLHGYAPGRNGQFINMSDIQAEQEGASNSDVETSYGLN